MIFKVTTAKDRGIDNILKDLNVLESEKVVSAPTETIKPKKEKKEKKSNKRKKKKKDDIELLSVDSNESTPLEDCEDPDIANMMKLLDVDELMSDKDSDEDDLSSTIIGAQRGSYKKRKKDSNEYKKEFAEELTLLYDLLGDTSEVAKKIKDYINFDNKKIGGINKNMSDMVNNLLSAQSTRLQVLKEISSVKKAAIDLTLKAESKKDKENATTNDQHAMASLIHGIMKAGRNDFIQAARGNTVGYLPQDTYDYGDQDDSIGNYAAMLEHGPGFTEEEKEDMMELIQERLYNEGSGVMSRNSETDAYIKYENRNVEVKVKLCVDTGEWEFFAVDRDNIIIHDYPLPRKKDVEPLKFTGALAIDKRGVQYKVIEYYSDALD